MKLVTMIPAYNEEVNISSVIKEIPKKIHGIDDIKVMVIDDGSIDNTARIAAKAGAIVFSNKKNQGLARAFKIGLEKALYMGADIIVNIDADGQYDAREIPKLIEPIISKKADIVSGDRQVKLLNHMPSSKKYGNIIGTKVVSLSSGLNLRDASSGFRAFSREAALKLNILSDHTYTHETIIQAKNLGLKFVELPVVFRKRTKGNSKLISSVSNHIKKSLATIIRTTLMYNSLKTYSYLGGIFLFSGLLILIRFLYFFFSGDGSGHIQSLIASVIVIFIGGLILLLGFLADLIASNRRYLEEILYRTKKNEFNKRNRKYI